MNEQVGRATTPGAPVLAPPATREEALRRARELAPALRARAEETEALRRLPDATVADLRSSGLVGVMTPRTWGGSELGSETMIDITIILAGACASTGWVYMLWTAHCWMLALFPERAQREMWTKPDVLASSIVSTQGTITPADGGYRWSGRGFFSSGVDHSEWLTASVDVPTENETGEGTQRRWLLIPRDDYSIVDDWNTVGLRGTGSKTVVFDDIFIPHYRTVSHFDAENGTAPGALLHDNPMFCGTSTVNFTAAMGVPAMGVAKGFLELFEARLSRRFGADPAHPFESPGLATTTTRFAEACASVDATIALVRENARTFSSVPARDVTVADRMRFRRDQSYGAQTARRTVNRLYEECGGGGLVLTSPLQRLWRDANAAAAHHGLTWDWMAENWGQSTLAGAPGADD